MDAATQVEAVVDLLGRLGIEVRKERLGGAGGSLCEIRGRRVVFIDLEADLATTLDRCLTALAALPEVDELYLPPELRERLEQLREQSNG